MDYGVDVLLTSRASDSWRLEGGGDRRDGDEQTRPHRNQLADRYAVASEDDGFPLGRSDWTTLLQEEAHACEFLPP
jgi:hypothetical protein